MRRLFEKLIAAAELCRIRISLFIAVSAIAGYLISPGAPSFPLMAWLAAGVFFLSCGASAFNQFAEAETDSLMPRTCTRPVPSGRMKQGHALLISAGLLLAGISVLFVTRGALPAALGAAAFLWYGVVYTPLKQKTPFALLPGALAGAVSPAIGWVCGGGSLLSPRLFIFCLFFYIWQIPHFWIFLLRYGRQYEEAGLPSVTTVFSGPGLRRIIFAWELCTAASALLIAALYQTGPFTRALSALPAAWIIAGGAAVFSRKSQRLAFALRSIDACALAITCLTAAGRFIAV